MSGHLKRLAPNLRAGGWQVTFHREARQRLVVIERTEVRASPPPVVSSPDDRGPVQHHANRRELFPDDARDDRDADSVPFGAPSQQNGDGWEEGEL